MEYSTEASVKKILLDFSEYERLKHIEAQYIDCQREKKQSTSSSKSSSSVVKPSNHQKGLGRNEIFPIPTSTIESEQEGEGSGSIGTEDQADDSILPSIATAEKNITHFPSTSFNVQVLKNDLNDSFDEEKLLALIPASQKKNAKTLLQQFNIRSNELTWNSSGTIFINQIAIPSSNIFVLFPLLFKKSPPNLKCLLDFADKIYDMGLSDLIIFKLKHVNLEPNKITTIGGNIMHDEKGDQNVPWWYLGD